MLFPGNANCCFNRPKTRSQKDTDYRLNRIDMALGNNSLINEL